MIKVCSIISREEEFTTRPSPPALQRGMPPLAEPRVATSNTAEPGTTPHALALLSFLPGLTGAQKPWSAISEDSSSEADDSEGPPPWTDSVEVHHGRRQVPGFSHNSRDG